MEITKNYRETFLHNLGKACSLLVSTGSRERLRQVPGEGTESGNSRNS